MSFTRHARTPLRIALAASAVAAVTALAGCGNNDMAGMPGMDQPTGQTASAAPSAAGTPAAGPHNQADVMFAQQMIPHHQQAIEMSDMILAKDDINPDVTALAEQIKAAQAPEIAQMTGWLTGWGQGASPSMPMDHDMGGGMMNQADMDALQQASGDEAAKLFLQGMITHHKGAIDMAKMQLANGQNGDAKQLAQQIVDSQQAEITTMQQLLAGL
jgi:uncharacterized protein (DUF305 family)